VACRNKHRVLGIVACLVLGGLFGCSSSEPDNDLLSSGKKLYSQFDEELIIRHFFADRRNGFFVDVGCYDWEEDSTTLYLEKHLGWSGIGIDANDGHAVGYAEHRPNTRFLNYLVGDESGGEETFYLADGALGISSASEQWIHDFYRDFGVKSEPKVREVTVPTITLNDLLEQSGVSKIDFLSMDIEGHEPKALARAEGPGRLRHRALPARAGVHRGGQSRGDRRLLHAARIRADREVPGVRQGQLVLHAGVGESPLARGFRPATPSLSARPGAHEVFSHRKIASPLPTPRRST
jgi:FkbM family methyltransferase